MEVFDLDYNLIEIHYNDIIKNKPYLVRIFNYNGSEPTEFRFDDNEIKTFYLWLKEQDNI